MGATIQDTLAEYAEMAKQQNTIQPPPAKPGAPPPVPQQAPGGPPAPAPPAKSPGIVDRVVNAAKAMVAPADMNPLSQKNLGLDASAGAGILRSGGQLIGGALDTVRDAGHFVDDNIHAGFVRSALTPVVGAAHVLDQASKIHGGASLADVLSNRQGLGQVGNPAMNQGTAEFAAAALPQLIPGVAETSLPLRMALAGGTSAAAISTAPGNTAAENLQERGIAGVSGAALEGAAGLIHNYFHAKVAGNTVTPASPSEVAHDGLSRDFATQRTQQARYAAVDPKGAEPVPQEVVPPGRHTDDTGATSSEAGTKAGGARDAGSPPDPLTQDANAALEKSGAAERIDPAGPPPVTPDGKLEVQPHTKAALDEAGLGRSFSTPKAIGEDIPADPVTYMKETSPDGGSRVVGSMDQQGLNKFLEDAKKYADHPETINTSSEHPAGQMNIRPLGSADDVAAMGRAFVDRLPDRGPPSAAEMVAATKELGLDNPQEAHIMAAQFSSKTEDLGKSVVAMRRQAAQINADMASLRGTDWTTVPDGDPRLVRALTAYHNGYSFMGSFRQGKSEIARGLQAMGQTLDGPAARTFGVKPEDVLPPTPVPDHDTYQNSFGKTPPEDLQPIEKGERPPLPRNKEELNDAINEHQLADSFGPDAVNAFWKGRTFSTDALKYLRTSFANFYTAGLVSRPTTFMRDLFGPGVMAGMETMERAGGGVAVGITKALQGDLNGASTAFANAADAPRAWASTFGDIQSSIQMALKTFQSGHSILGGPGPYLHSLHSNIPPELISAAANGSPVQATMFSAGNLINTLPDFIHRLHGGVNELALRLSYLGHIRASALSYGRSTGLDGDALSDYVRSAVMGSEDPLTGAATDVSALGQAQRTTFTKPVIDNPANYPFLRSVDSTLRNMRENIPETRLVLPIYGVPANAFGETLRRIPVLGGMFKDSSNDLRGLNGELAQASAYGRQMMGAGLLTSGAIMAHAGILTGAGPSDPHDREVWTQAGYQPYSIKGPDGKFHSYSRIDGLGPLLGMMASLTDASTRHNVEDLGQRAVGLVSGLAEYMKDQSSLKGISDLLSFGGDPSQDGHKVERVLQGWASGFVPRFMQDPRNALDPLKRVVNSPWEAIENATPILSKNLDPVRNLYGDVNHVAQQDAAILPVTTSGVNPQGPNADEMAEHHRLMLSSGYAPGLLPTALNGAGIDQRQIKLEDGHSMYDARMRYRGLVTNDDGQTIHDAVRSTMQSDDYQQGYDGHNPRELQDEDHRYNRSALVATTFDEFDKAAKAKLINDSPTAAKYFAIADAKSKGLPGTEAHTTGEIANNPGLAGALGIDVDAYKEKFAQ